MQVTMKNVADKAGVSLATVSRVFSGNGYVNAETAKLIKDIAKELGFSPRKYTHKVSPSYSTGNIGVMLTQIDNPFYAEAVMGVNEIAHEHDLIVTIYDTEENTNLEIVALNKLKDQLDGLIIIPTSETTEYNSQFIMDLNSKHMPIVLMDREVKDVYMDGAFVESFSGMYGAVQVLIDNGHRDIAIITGPTTTRPGLDRFNGYVEALRNNQIPRQEEYILYGDFREGSGYNLTKKLLETRRKITALVSCNMMMSMGCLRAFEETGTKVPDDIAFISFDDLPYFSFPTYNISAVHNPARQLGMEAARILIGKMKKSRKHRNVMVTRTVLNTKLILRGSEKLITP